MSVLILRSAQPADAVSGLLFGQNGAAGDGNSTRFEFTSPLPWYPATYLWKIYPLAQTGFCTTFFHGPGDGSFNSTGYYGAHPYPAGGEGSSGTSHNWEISVQGQDIVTDDNGNNTAVVRNQWYDQMLVVRLVNTNELELKFYWDLATSTNRVITFTTTNDYTTVVPGSPVLNWGDAPWSPNQETLSGRLRGMQIYTATKTAAQGLALHALTSNNAVITHQDASNLWYLNLNPTPSDIADKSGGSHNPVWHNSNRASLWTP